MFKVKELYYPPIKEDKVQILIIFSINKCDEKYKLCFGR